MGRVIGNLDLFGGEQPESKKEKRAKQIQPLRNVETVTMRRLWKTTTSIQSKREKIHWSAAGSSTKVACGIKLSCNRKAVLVEQVTCGDCQCKASQVWAAMAEQQE